MGFRESLATEILVACHRRCCVCHVFCGVKMELDHIVPSAEGGTDDADNAIAVCFDCHAEIHHYNVKHPRGRRFSASELRAHRDQWLATCREKPGALVEGSRATDSGPLQAIIDELDYNVTLAASAKEGLAVNAPFSTRQFHRAVAGGALAVLDERLKFAIHKAYIEAEATNQQHARVVSCAGHEIQLRLIEALSYMRRASPALVEARDLLLNFASLEC